MWRAQGKGDERKGRRKGMESLRPCSWACSEELHDCHQYDGALSGVILLTQERPQNVSFVIR